MGFIISGENGDAKERYLAKSLKRMVGSITWLIATVKTWSRLKTSWYLDAWDFTIFKVPKPMFFHSLDSLSYLERK